MSGVPVWTFFAYMTGDAEGKQDQHRRVAPWQIHSVLDWYMDRGYDHIYLSRDPVETTEFKKAEPTRSRHRMHVVEAADHVPGDEAA